MSLTATVKIEDFAFLDESARGVNDHTSNPVTIVEKDHLLMSFLPLPSNMHYKRITDGSAHVYLTKLVGETSAYTAPIFQGFDPETITYNTKPNIYYSSYAKVAIARGWNVISDGVDGYELNGGLAFSLPEFSDGSATVATGGTNAPYLSITVDESDTIGLTLSNLSPKSGAILKSQDNIFAWTANNTSVNKCYPKVEQAFAVFRWRSGTSGTIHTINVSGNSQSVTVPANTFAGTTSIQWQVAVTANSGVVTTSDWMTLSTADATPTAAPLSPVDTVIDGSKDVLFQWQHSISTGTAQSKADLQKSTDGSTWQTLAAVTGAVRQWTCPAGTLTSSIKYWRVRTYNADGIPGEWSNAAQIVVIAAPTAPSIQIKSTGPRPSISWQTSEQEAYRVELDGTLSGGTHYGAEKSWTSPSYLADGSHTVRVRVQNQYGMWSDWGAAALPVTNTPGAAITLNVEASSIADLNWQTTGSYDFYLVYRDGKPIAKLAQTQYTDELSSGNVTYQVRGCYDDSDNYGMSAEVRVRVLADVHMVSDLDTGATLRLPYSDSQHRQTVRTVTRQVELLQLSGAYYPVAVEVDSGTDALSITAALIDDEQVRKLMALVGKLVCAKTPQGDMVIGYITSLPKQHDGFLNVFSFTVDRIDYDDEVTI